MADTTQADVIEITQIRSDIGANPAQRRTLRALGLRRIRHTVSHQDRPEVRGMLAKVAHLVQVRDPGDQPPANEERAVKAESERPPTSSKKSSQRSEQNDEVQT